MGHKRTYTAAVLGVGSVLPYNSMRPALCRSPLGITGYSTGKDAVCMHMLDTDSAACYACHASLKLSRHSLQVLLSCVNCERLAAVLKSETVN